MSLSITSQPSSLLLQLQPNTSVPGVKAPVDIKDKALEALENRESKVNARIENAVSSRNERLDGMHQFAENNGYEHLANLAGRATNVVNNVGQRAADRVEHRFDVAGQIVEQRPDGGYKITEQNAEAMIDRLQTNADARIARIGDVSATASDRFAELEQIAINKGYDGSRIETRADRVAENLQQATDHQEQRTTRAIERIQSRLDEVYGNQPEPAPGELPDGGIIVY